MVFEVLLSSIFYCNSKVRFAAIIDCFGSKIEGGMRPGTESLNPQSEEEKMYAHTALRRGLSSSWTDRFGEMKWCITAHKRVTIVELPVGKDNCLLMTLEPDAPAAAVAEDIATLTDHILASPECSSPKAVRIPLVMESIPAWQISA